MTRNVVFVTGGASGIGFAVVKSVVARGWRAVVADIDAANIDQAREQLASHHSLVHYTRLDVSDEQAVQEAVGRCESEIGPLTGLVNCAGIGADVFCLDTTAALFRQVIETNLIGSFVVAREAARRMATRGRGSIVNIGSVSGIRGNSGRVAYGASKAGVLLMTQVMAVELASFGVRINVIAPGPIETPLIRRLQTDQIREDWIRFVPQHRYGTPEDVASAALFLLDDNCSGFVTGQTLCVDGGFTAAGLVRAQPNA
jgi:NAD(P)-dependent dehydrogenase (short-subunit alcohol dehydrogenase family)